MSLNPFKLIHQASNIKLLLPSATKLRQGNIFRQRVSRILSTGGGVSSLSVHAGIHHATHPLFRHPPPGKTPTGAWHPLGRHPPADCYCSMMVCILLECILVVTMVISSAKLIQRKTSLLGIYSTLHMNINYRCGSRIWSWGGGSF